MPEDANRVEYWQKVMKNHEGNTDVPRRDGKGILRRGQVNDAVLCFEKAIKIDPANSLPVFGPQHISHWAAMVTRDNAELLQNGQ